MKMNRPSGCVYMHMHVHMCVCMSAMCRKMKHLVFVFTTSQKQLKIKERSPEGQSQVLPVVTYVGWISGNFSFLLRIWGSEEGKKANLTSFLFP